MIKRSLYSLRIERTFLIVKMSYRLGHYEVHIQNVFTRVNICRPCIERRLQAVTMPTDDVTKK